ncbi:MAG: hypothetical protein IJZ44_07835 [Lachnospiraceae bacterium]|nr:hypothetical protein [Lachnospiraceae bacterium]
MKRFKGMKGTIILIVLACLIIGYYYYLSNSLDSPTANVTGEEEIVATMTMSQKALSRNLQSNYPPSPREVVKYFGEITQCYYNEEHDEEEIIALGLKMREIYDAELVANQTEEEYLDLLKRDIEEYRANNRTIANYSPSSSVDVEVFTQDGYEWARLYCIFDVKQDSILYPTNMCFILRKDAEGHYKIYGWKKMDMEQ